MWGPAPGPTHFIEQFDFFWGLFSSLCTKNLAAVPVNLVRTPLFVCALLMPFRVHCTRALGRCIVGGSAPIQKMRDVWPIAGFGVVGDLMRKASDPTMPLVLALVLDPLIEKSCRQTLISERGNMLAFIERPLSGRFIALNLVFFLPPLLKYAKKFTRAQEAQGEPAEQPK